MNKTSKLFLGFASLAMLSACSSDEPKGEVTPPAEGNGTTMYLAVNISDANAMGRELEDKNEGALVPGSVDEHTIKTANFFFFDANGIYLTQASVWNGGQEGPAEFDNVEYLGNNVLVLEGLTETNLPKYVVTMLNTPETIVNSMLANVTTMDELRQMQIDSYINNETFVMTTSSFLGGNAKFYDDAHYYANVIPADYLLKEPIAISNPEKKLEIYVERLAAKYSMSLPKGNEFTISLTVVGESNDNDNDPNVGDTQLKVSITGFGVTTTEKTSYLSKNLDGFNTNNVFTNWNSAALHRSYWGKSVNYDKTITAETFNHDKFASYNLNRALAPVYSFENTNTVANLTREGSNPAEVNASLVTNFVFTADVTNADGTEIKDLVKFDGIFFKDDQFMKYLLRRIQETVGLNYYKQVEATSSEIDGIIENGAKYAQIGLDEFKFVKKDNGGKMTVEFDTEEAIYSYDKNAEAGKKFTVIPAATVKAEINGKIENILSANYPVRYNGGKTVYTVPVQHLMGFDNKYEITKLGEFGVVRNHWYEISINSIGKIGQGVFDPTFGEDGDIIYPDPDPDPDTYGLAAKINILSWKVVKQSVDL